LDKNVPYIYIYIYIYMYMYKNNLETYKDNKYFEYLLLLLLLLLFKKFIKFDQFYVHIITLDKKTRLHKD